MSEINQETRIFSLSGNHLSLDFINTLDDRMDIQPSELLASYSDLVSWSQQTGIMTDEEAQELLKEATQQPARKRYGSKLSRCAKLCSASLRA